MSRLRSHLLLLCLVIVGRPVAAQTPSPTTPPGPPPLWDVQIGASFVGTSGNSQTSSTGADFALHRRWPIWQVESTATAVRTSDHGIKTAERYIVAARAQRALTSIVRLSGGERAERDRFSGIDFRNVLDGGLSWALVRTPAWTLDGVTSLAWNHEQPVIGVDRDDPIGLLQALSRVPFGTSGDTTQRITFYPDFGRRSAYRSEAELTAQAAMNAHLALKVGYLWRYSNAPVIGFKKTDNTTTASVVLRWRAAAAAAVARD